jgi:hypothetical protein
MNKWSDTLVEKLYVAALDTYRPTGLSKGLAPIEFEEHHGELLREVPHWARAEHGLQWQVS